MQVSYQTDVVDDEVMSDAFLQRPKPVPNPRKIVIGRRKPLNMSHNQSALSSNASLMSGGSCAGSIKNSLPGGLVGMGMARVGGTATPNRGPSRFVSVNHDRNTRTAEIAKQTELVMKNLNGLQDDALFNAGLTLAPLRSYSESSDEENMVRPRVPGTSPARQQGRLPLSPVKNRNQPQLYEIGQEFSPSPVKHVAGREMFDNTEPALDIITRTCVKAYVSLARLDVAQLARKNGAKQAAEAAEEAAEGSGTLQAECRYLMSWIPRLRNKKLYVEGDLLDLDSSSPIVGSDQKWVTIKIYRRVSNTRVATKKGTVYVLEGQLVVRSGREKDKLAEDGPTPNFILDKFRDGFPENWERLVGHWIKFDDQNSINTFVFNSTSMTNNNMSMSNMTALQNISSISGNTSRYLTSRSRVPATTQLSFNKGVNLSIMPEEEQDTTRPQFEVITVCKTSTRSRSNKRREGAKMFPNREDVDQRSRSPLRSNELKTVSLQTERRSKSKTVRHNKNSRRSEEVLDKSPRLNMMVTMSGLGIFVCFACEYSSNDEGEMVTHLMSSSHRKKIRTCQEKKYLSCNVCMLNTDRKDDLIKHMRTKKHIKKSVNFEKQKVMEESTEKPKSAEKPGKDSKKQTP